jgi:hypothetical protein
MIRRSPAEYYIKYLMLLPEKLSDDDVTRTLRLLHLDYPGRLYLKRLRLTLKPPIPFYPTQESDLESYKFLQEHRVHRLFFRDKHVNIALLILQQPRAKEIVESALIASETRGQIIQRLRLFGFHVTEQSIKYYAHFFLNLKLVDPTELRALLQVRVDDMALDTDDKEALVRHKAMKQAMYLDPRYLAANSVHPPTTLVRLQLRYGLIPSRVDYTVLAEAARTSAIAAAVEYSQRAGPKDGANARDFATVAATMDALLRERGDGDAVLRKSLLTLETDDTPMKSVHQLTAGKFMDSVIDVEVEGEKVDAK